LLDVSIRLGILNLLAGLREREGMTILYITHDIASARYLADEIAVMYAGRLVESAPAISVTDQPAHPYTQLLLSARADPTGRGRPGCRPRRGAQPAHATTGCRFHPRCRTRWKSAHNSRRHRPRSRHGHVSACCCTYRSAGRDGGPTERRLMAHQPS
jgi:oligopeptide/dipeptide ABC transporter ATP-binding protein